MVRLARLVLLTAALSLGGAVLLAADAAMPSRTVSLRVLPSGPPRPANALEEAPFAVQGARAVAAQGFVSPHEAEGLAEAMAAAYAEMAAAEGSVPSALGASLAGQQGPDAFDLILVDAPEPDARDAVIFLHGFGGPFTWPCWQVAQAARSAGLRTACPSIGLQGDWWTADGEHVVARTLDHLEASGARRVFLVGLSNGAAGASVLAPRLAARLDGLVLISGVHPDGGTGGLPTLVVHGTDDTMMPAGGARSFAARNRATWADYPGNHFVLLHRRAEITTRIGDWLRER